MPLHLNHVTAKVKDQIVAKSICDLHASLVSVPLGRREDNVHLLVGEVVLQELLILETVCRARDHTDVHGLDEYLHGHYRVRIAAIQHQHRLDPVLVDHARKLEEKHRVHVQADKKLRDMIDLHHFIVEDGAHVILMTVVVLHLLVHANALGSVHAPTELI